jgi:imidazolonepropionase-like amidohydrolase
MKTLIRDCHIVDVEAGKVMKNAWLVIEGTLIVDFGYGEVKSPAAETFDQVIDAEGGYLSPGLINLHVHIQRRHLHHKGKGVFRQGAAALENSEDARRMLFAMRNGWDELLGGVTTIRDCCSKSRLNTMYRDAVNEGIVIGPHVVSCGLGIASTGGHETHRYPGAVEVDGVDEVMKAVRTEIKNHADFIKFMGSGGLGGLPEHEHPYWVELSYNELKAGIDEAHHRMKTCTIHAMGFEAVRIAVEAGIDGIEHGTNLNPELVALMKERKVYYVPTMSGIATVADRESESGSKDLAEFIRKLVVRPQFESVRLAHAQGLLIGAGTDTLGDLVTELEMFTQCGMSAAEALRTATSNAALILKRQESIGSIAHGKLADLILVDQNPLEGIENLRNLRWVMKEGLKLTKENLAKVE